MQWGSHRCYCPQTLDRAACTTTMPLVWDRSGSEHWVLLPPKEPNRHTGILPPWRSPGSSAALCHQLTVQVCSRHKQLAERRPDAHLTVGHGQSKQPTSFSFSNGRKMWHLPWITEWGVFQTWQWDADPNQSKVMTHAHRSTQYMVTTQQANYRDPFLDKQPIVFGKEKLQNLLLKAVPSWEHTFDHFFMSYSVCQLAGY